MSRPEISRDLQRVLKSLKLGQLLPLLPERLRLAREREMAPEEVLLLVLSEECTRRDQQRVFQRAQRAGLEEEMVLEAWDGGTPLDYDRELLEELRSLRFLESHHHVLLLGPVGVGKTMLAQGLGHLAVRRGYKVRFERSDKLFLQLKGSRLDGSHAQEIRRLVEVDLLIVDDFALRRLDELETADLYEVVTGRHRRGSMIMTSNRSPEEWLAQMSDVLLGQAVVDRFSNNAHDLILEGESYRKRQKPQRKR